MAIPTHEQLQLPVLKMMADNKEHHKSEISDYLDKEFQFTDKDKAQLVLPEIVDNFSRCKFSLKILNSKDKP